ncbi:MAG: hypothetical protein HZA58_07345 [Acidimicrobiia bacterium]|nr:hypothetical protein [Acidimicrobiia bacterium]
MALRRHPMLLGRVHFESGFLSSDWRLRSSRGAIASFRRYPSLHLSRGWIDRTPVEIKPQGWGTVVFFEEGREMGRIIRRSWAGRRWDLVGDGFGCELVSEPLPRHWTLRIGGQPIAHIAGTPLSYNRLRVQADISVPVWALALVWHVVVRPWEAAAEPRTLRPVSAPR